MRAPRARLRLRHSRESGDPALEGLDQRLDWTDIRLSKAARLRGNDEQKRAKNGAGACKAPNPSVRMQDLRGDVSCRDCPTRACEKRCRTRLVFARQGDVAWQGLVRSGDFRSTSAGPFGAFMDSYAGGSGNRAARLFLRSTARPVVSTGCGAPSRPTCRSLDTRHSPWRTRRFASG